MSTESNPAGTMARLQAAEAELRRLREQEPVAKVMPVDAVLECENDRIDRMLHVGTKLYAAPVPPPDVRELVEALRGLLGIVSDSSGVAGYHLNGDIAAWGEFEEIETATTALAKFRGQS